MLAYETGKPVRPTRQAKGNCSFWVRGSIGGGGLYRRAAKFKTRGLGYHTPSRSHDKRASKTSTRGKCHWRHFTVERRDFVASTARPSFTRKSLRAWQRALTNRNPCKTTKTTFFCFVKTFSSLTCEAVSEKKRNTPPHRSQGLPSCSSSSTDHQKQEIKLTFCRKTATASAGTRSTSLPSRRE